MSKIEWGPERPHDGSDKCPAEARDVPCTIKLLVGWHGEGGGVHGWVWPWEHVTAYCLPADVPAPAPADPVRDALVDALEAMLGSVCGPTGFAECVRADTGLAYPWPALELAENRARTAIALAKGEKT